MTWRFYHGYYKLIKVIMCLGSKINDYISDYKDILDGKKMLSDKDGLWHDHDK